MILNILLFFFLFNWYHQIVSPQMVTHALVRSFQNFTIKFLNQTIFLARLKSASKSLLNWQGKCDVFLRKLYQAIDPSNLASENDVTALRASDERVKIISCF